LNTNLKGQRVLVTAASKGIGFGAAKALLEEGARVVINSSNRQNISEAKRRLQPLGEVHDLAADIALREDIDKLVDFTVE
jgi:NAD(P)-dependent dehydrogenase (short-subunit alcohol dehydrogenase family)